MDELSIQESPTTPYAFTLRKTKLPASKKDYESRLDKIRDLQCEITDHVYEYESGIHCHGVIQVPKNFNTIKLRVRGWRLQLDELYNYAGWLCYMTKCNALEAIAQQQDHEQDPDFKMPKCKLF